MVQKNLGSKRFWIKKYCVQKDFDERNFAPTKFGPKKFDLKVTAKIFLIWRNVPGTNDAWTNFPMTLDMLKMVQEWQLWLLVHLVGGGGV